MKNPIPLDAKAGDCYFPSRRKRNQKKKTEEEEKEHDTYLETTPQPQHQMESALLLNVIVRKRAAIFQLLTSKDETLLIWWDPFLILDFALYVINCVRALDFECDGFAGQGFHEDLHTTTKTKDKVECGFFLDIVIRECSAVLELFSGKDEPLLVRWDTLFILDFAFNVVNGI